MEKSEAIEFCKVHYINYIGIAEGLMYSDYCAEVSALLYGALKPSHSAKWGRVFYACKKSGCFHVMELSDFRALLGIVFSGKCPALSTIKDGVEQITLAYQKRGTTYDDAKYKTYRREVLDLSNAIRAACHRELENSGSNPA